MRVYSPADSADDAEECSKLHYIAEKDRLFEVIAVVAVLLFGFRLRKSARSAGDFWGFICANRLSTHACYSPADSADDADECSKLHYHAEKDSLFEVKAVLGFRGLSAIICEICGRLLGFHLCNIA